MKVTVKNEKAKIVRNVEMAVGELGRITENITNNDYGGRIVIRAYEILVSLDDPNCTWPAASSPNLEIELFPKGTEIILITE